MLSAAFAAIPLPYKLMGAAIGVAVLLASLVGFYAWAHHDGAASCEADVAKAVVAAQQEDQKRSAALLAEQSKKLTALHAQALSSLQKVQNAPITNSCGPVQRDASHGVQSLIRGGTAAP